MSLELIASIITGVAGLLICYFLSRLVGEFDKAKSSISELTNSVNNLTFTVKQIESKAAERDGQAREKFQEFHEEIEMLRDRSHKMTGWIQAIRLQGQLKSGWTFMQDWVLPGLHQD